MTVTISQFRRDLFELVGYAMGGGEVWVSYKGRRFKLVPEDQPASRFSRLTTLQVVNPESAAADELSSKDSMQIAWERDWAEL